MSEIEVFDLYSRTVTPMFFAMKESEHLMYETFKIL